MTLKSFLTSGSVTLASRDDGNSGMAFACVRIISLQVCVLKRCLFLVPVRPHLDTSFYQRYLRANKLR